jgi:5-methylcytosine-specific restriction endonuclease McrA
VHQCLSCGSTAGPQIKYGAAVEEAFGDPIPPFDEDFERRTRERWVAHNTKTFHEQREAESREWWARYTAYLATPQWEARRRLVLQRAAGICEGCRIRAAVQVHHLTYSHVGNELLFQLVALCTACHEKAHQK